MKCCLCSALWGIPASVRVGIRSVLFRTTCVLSCFSFFSLEKEKGLWSSSSGPNYRAVIFFFLIYSKDLSGDVSRSVPCSEAPFFFFLYFFPSAVTTKLSVHISPLCTTRRTQSSGEITSRLRHSPSPPPPLRLLLASCPSGDS